jgi:hypothetical protein
MMRPAMMTTVVLAVLAAAASPAAAQTRASAGLLDVAVGALYMNRSPLTSGDAKETTPTGESFSLFSTSTTLSAMTGAELHVGVHMTPGLELFGAASFGSRQLRIEATNDKENAAAVTASEKVQQFAFTGGALWFLSEARIAPFLSVEAGQLRELHEDKTLVESGLVYMAGAGVSMLFSDRGAVGLRLAGRAVVRSKQFLLNTKKVSPAVGVSVFVRF